MEVKIISPESTLYEGEARQVRVPGEKGSFAALHRHAPIMSTLTRGAVKVTDPDGQERTFDIAGGVAHVEKDVVTILVDGD